MPLRSVRLVERELELGRLAEAIDRTSRGSGSLVVVEGPAGFGKSSVLAAGAGAAQERGCATLTAVGAEFERDLGFGVVRQLFEPALLGLSAAAQRRLLRGAAGLARPLLLPSSRAGSSPADRAGLMHGLYWLAANLSERLPLVVTVDDAHWCDRASLQWLLYLARRLDDLPIVLIVAVRSGAPQSRGGALQALAGSNLGQRLELSALSPRATAELVREGWVPVADDEVCRALFEVTGGNPFLLCELVRALGEEAFTARTGLAERVRRLTPRTVSRSVIARLSRLPTEASALAYALALMGGRAAVHELLAVAGVAHEPGLRALDALEREQIASGRPVRFVHPLLGAAIAGELPPGGLALAHARAARALAGVGADPAHVANHLLRAEPAGDRWAVEMLRQAARSATRDGAPETASTWLTRALAEPPSSAELPRVLHELGAAELLSGRLPAEPAAGAEGHLAQAVETYSDPRDQALAALDWGDALWATHRYLDAVHAFDRGINAVRATDSELALQIEAHAMAAARLDLRTCSLVAGRLERFADDPPPTAGGSLIAGVLAVDRALSGAPAQEVIGLAERMLAGEHTPSHVAAQIPLFATNALLWSDRFEQSRGLLDQMIAMAREAGSARGAMIGLCWRGLNWHRRGELNQAVSDLTTALKLAAEHSSGGTVVTQALLAEALLDQGNRAAAAKTMSAIATPDHLPGYIGWNYVLHARGALHVTELNFRAALEDFLACGDRQERWRAANPSVIPWRSSAALASLALGDRVAALKLASEELRLARRFGAPRAIGVALRAQGRCERGDRQITLLREASHVLERSQARLEHAGALADLGSALRRAGERVAARDPLRQALELAIRCGASPLVERTRNELAATGSRPRKEVRFGADSLTPIERQVATTAAQGLSNPQIAQALFISRKTVEKRLSEAYRKLDIRSRDQLASALNAPASAPTEASAHATITVARASS